MKHFTSKIYLVTYEHGQGLGNRKYGIMGAFNKPTEASRHIAKLQKVENDKGFGANKIEYKVQILDLDNPLPKELFAFDY